MEAPKNKSKLMRKNKKRHNEKARQVVDIVIDKREQDKIKIEDIGNTSIAYDDCNALVLPSKKRRTKKLQKRVAKPLLSKKKKKHLEKLMEKKHKKANRVALLEELSKVQAKPAELQCLTSLQTNQTLGRKLCLQQNIEKTLETNDSKNVRIENVLKGLNKRLPNYENRPNKKRRYLDRSKIVETSSEDEEDENELNSEITEIEEVQYVDAKSNGHATENGDCRPKVEKLEPDEAINISDTNKVEKQAPCEPVNSTDENEVQIVKDIINTKPAIIEKTESLKAIPAVYKVLNRLPEIKEYRLKLPVVSLEYEIMTAINENTVVIIDGSTGSGKTTQVPQFLFEAGFTDGGKMIAVTEPRRVAAIEMSKRVAYEMNLGQDVVSYQIRFEGNTTEKTQIKFLTDGVLFKEFLNNPLLDQYSAIIIDEAHERSVFSDIMISILSRVIKAREKKKSTLKVVIMSATMDENSFTENSDLFPKRPPIVKVDSKMFDVAIHYNKVTHMNYLDDAYKKACKIHRQLPRGGILIFVTGKEEVLKLCRKLINTFPKRKNNDTNKLCPHEEKMQTTKKKLKNKKAVDSVEESIPDMPNIKLSDFSEETLQKLEDAEKAVENSGELDDDDCLLTEREKMRLLSFEGDSEREAEQALHVLPMFSLLSSEKLNLVFQDPPPGTRLCVVATNIAETSLTIPNIVYVIDTGKIKGKIYNPVTGVSKMQIMWTSKASADQRKGRAGRVQSGHVYRLYSATAFTDLFPSHAQADILRRPLDDVVLAMKRRNIPVMTFPYITSPAQEELRCSIERLKLLGALSEIETKEGKDFSKITPFGKQMCQLPVSPRFSKMLLESFVYPELLPYFILIVCGLTVNEVVLENSKYDVAEILPASSEIQNSRSSWLGTGMCRYLGDLMILISGILKAEEAPNPKKFCESYGIRYKAYQEIRRLRRQVTNEINVIIPELNIPILPEKSELTNAQVNTMRKIILQGSLDRVARKVLDCEISTAEMKKKFSNAYRISNSEEPIFLHHFSPFKREHHNWIVYQDIYEVNGKKIMRGVSTIEPIWISQLAPDMCMFSHKFPTSKRNI